MKQTLIAVLAATSLTLSTAHASDESDALLKVDQALAAQSHAIGFVPAFSKAMAADARKFDGGSPPAIGHDSIMALFAQYGSDLKLDWTPKEAIVAKSGELGFTWGNYVATSPDKNGALKTSYGVYMDVWRRDSDGVWRWIADMGVGTPPPADKSSAEKASAAADPAIKSTQ